MSVPLIGTSRALQVVLDAIAMVARVDCAVLIQGETGTGKELVARAVHEAGPRRRQPFVAVNCAAIPAALVESELFGYERGAFTGAVAQTAGRFQAADRGTLFLDEIGDLPLDVQPKLLRALQEQEVERLGGSGRTVPVDVRIVAATNQDLWSMVQARRFRADLYYRLNVFPIAVPPLRERKEDVPLLVAHFVQQFAERQGKVIDDIPDDVIDSLTHRAWPGNVRELQNIVERAVIGTTSRVLQAPGSELQGVRDAQVSRTLADVEREHILATLRDANWVVGGWNGAAARLGLSRTTLIARMQRLGLSKGAEWRGGRASASPASGPVQVADLTA